MQICRQLYIAHDLYIVYDLNGLFGFPHNNESLRDGFILKVVLGSYCDNIVLTGVSFWCRETGLKISFKPYPFVFTVDNDGSSVCAVASSC